MNDQTGVQGPTSAIGERVCAVRKQAADARLLLERLLTSCAHLRGMLGSDKGSPLLQVEEELHGAIVQAARVSRGLERVQW
jgi:hypothetical protein